MENRIDILNLEWETDSRDTNIVEPVLVSLEQRFGYSVKRESIWYGFLKLLKYRPRVLLVSNELGAVENYYLCRFAYAIGIKTIVFISEGLNYDCLNDDDQRKLETELLWGHNREHLKIWDMKLLWSNATRKAIYQYVPEARKLNLHVSGATGFDSYKLLHIDGWSSLKRYRKEQYRKVILLVGFAFDLYPTYDSENIHMDEETIKWLYGQRYLVRDIYRDIIEKNQDILFIVKHHPGSLNLEDTEFSGLMKTYDNTITVHKEISIRNLLSVSDIIVAFDSTVCLEAWMLEKPTILVNPEDRMFPRSWNYLGSPIAKDFVTLQYMIEEYYYRGKIHDFEDLQPIRQKMIKRQIQFDDGFNYLRAAKLIDEEIKKKRKHKIDCKANKIAITRIIRECAEYAIEKQPLPVFKKSAHKTYIERRKRYNKDRRNDSIVLYVEGIKRMEEDNPQKVLEILNKYKG